MARLIALTIKDGPFNGINIIRQIVSISTEKKIDYLEMKRRVAILDALELAEKDKADTLEIEEAEYDILREAEAGFAFIIANKEILTVRDDIRSAKVKEKA